MFDIFTKKAATAQPATPATPVEPPNPGKVTDVVPSTTPVQSDKTAPNGVVPDTVNTTESPLDKFKDLWDTDPNAKTPGEYKPELLDPAKLQEVMSKVDMSSIITPDNLAAIQQGGEEASKAFVSSLNAVSQQTLTHAALVANKMTETSVQKAMEAMMEKLPSMLKEQNLTNSLTEQNPIYSHKAVAPVMEAIKSQLAMKFPSATTTELTKMAQDYVKATSEAFNPAVPATPGNAQEGINWDSWADITS